MRCLKRVNPFFSHSLSRMMAKRRLQIVPKLFRSLVTLTANRLTGSLKSTAVEIVDEFSVSFIGCVSSGVGQHRLSDHDFAEGDFEVADAAGEHGRTSDMSAVPLRFSLA